MYGDHLNIDSVRQYHLKGLSATTYATAGAWTVTIAALKGGICLRDPNGGARTDTLPTAALAVAGFNKPFVGQVVRCIYCNTADAAETITLAAGTGGTAKSGTLTVAQNETKEVVMVFTNVTSGSEAYDLYVV